MRVSLFLLIWLAALTLSAQDTLTVEMLVPQQAIKISPLHLLNFYPTVEISYEHKLIKRFSAQVELGYVLRYPSINRDFSNKRGAKIKLEGRYYFAAGREGDRVAYWALEPYANIINFDRKTSRTECFDAACEHAFIRNYQYKMEYREHGASVKIGYMRYFSKFFMDCNFGLTLRSIQYIEPAEAPDGMREAQEFIEIPNETDRVVFCPVIGLRMGYRLQ